MQVDEAQRGGVGEVQGEGGRGAGIKARRAVGCGLWAVGCWLLARAVGSGCWLWAVGCGLGPVCLYIVVLIFVFLFFIKISNEVMIPP